MGVGGHSKALFQGLTSFFCKGLGIFTLWTILSLMQLLNSAHGVGVGEQKSLCSNETLFKKQSGRLDLATACWYVLFLDLGNGYTSL